MNQIHDVGVAGENVLSFLTRYFAQLPSTFSDAEYLRGVENRLVFSSIGSDEPAKFHSGGRLASLSRNFFVDWGRGSEEDFLDFCSQPLGLGRNISSARNTGLIFRVVAKMRRNRLLQGFRHLGLCFLNFRMPCLRVPRDWGSPDVLFFAHERKHLSILEPLKFELERRGFSVMGLWHGNLATTPDDWIPYSSQIWLFRARSEPSSAESRKSQAASIYKRVKVFVSKLDPKAVVACEGDSPIHEAGFVASRHLGSLGVCIQWGVIDPTNPKPSFIDSSAHYFLAWSQCFADAAQALSPRAKSVTVGNLALNQPVAALATEKFVRVLVLLNGSNGQFQNFFGPYRNLSDDLIQFAQVLSELHTVDEVIVRAHPSIHEVGLKCPSEGDLVKLRFSDPSTSSLSNDCSGATFAIGGKTSALVEAAALGVVPIHINPNPKYPFFPSLASWGLEFDSVEEAEQGLQEVLADPIRVRELQGACNEMRLDLITAFGKDAQLNASSFLCDLIDRRKASGDV